MATKTSYVILAILCFENNFVRTNASMYAFQKTLPQKTIAKNRIISCDYNAFWELKFPYVNLLKPFEGLAKRNRNYTLHDLAPKRGSGITIVIIDTGLCGYSKQFLQANQIDLLPDSPMLPDSPICQHGTHLYKIIAGDQPLPRSSNRYPKVHGRIGIAPKARVIMIRAFNPDGTAHISQIIKALKIAYEDCHADIVCLGLKIGNGRKFATPLYKSLEKWLSKFPFVVAAAGNGSEYGEAGYDEDYLAYPACLSNVLAVGAYGIDDNQSIKIPYFCQTMHSNSKFLRAPGCHIANVINMYEQKKFPDLLFMDGTSCACAFFTGFLALVLAERGNEFSLSDLEKIIFLLAMSDRHFCLDMCRVFKVLYVISQSCIHFPCLKSFSLDILLSSINVIIDKYSDDFLFNFVNNYQFKFIVIKELYGDVVGMVN